MSLEDAWDAVERIPCLRDSCCKAMSKDECQWPPCPANLDIYSSAELAAFIEQDAARVDRAVHIFVHQDDS